jgi:hypothetical protein
VESLVPPPPPQALRTAQVAKSVARVEERRETEEDFMMTAQVR